MEQNLKMESNIDKEIIDPNLLGQLIKSLFPNLPISMLYENDEIPIKVINAEKEFIIIKSVGRKDASDRLLTFTNNGSLYHFHFKYTNQNNQFDDTEYLVPFRLVIMKNGLRKKERIPVSEKDNSSYFIKSFININEIFHKLIDLPDWEKSLNKTISLIQEKFPDSKFIYFKDNDFRSKVIKISGNPIFLANSKNHYYNSNFSDLEEIKNYISEEFHEEINGPEISIPVYFKGKILLGYIKIVSETDLELVDFIFVSNYANSLVREINKNESFIFSKEKGKILDLSSSGLGFLHARKGYEDSFKVGDKILLEMHMDKGLFAVFQIIIRNVFNVNENFQRIGSEFYELNEEESIFLHNFSEKL